MYRILLLTIATAVALTSHAADIYPHDYASAVEYCDTHSLDNVEGIWEFVDDNVAVMAIKETNSITSPYLLIVVDSHDAFTACGEELGRLRPSADASIFTLTLFTKRSGLQLIKPRDCVATLSKEKNAFTLSANTRGKLSFKINITSLLPRLWRFIRISTDGGESHKSAPHGLIKTYPSYDGNGSSRLAPRYL
jgi:hypothetical protein